MIHVCRLDRECRRHSAPNRVHFATKSWFVTVALAPGDRMMVRRKDAPAFRPGEPDSPGLYRPRWVTVSRKGGRS